MSQKKASRYLRIIERVFLDRYKKGMVEVAFVRADLERVAKLLKIKLPKNLGDLIYTFRYRGDLPQAIIEKAPPGQSWVIRAAGSGRYCFALSKQPHIRPNESLLQTKFTTFFPFKRKPERAS